MLYIILKDRDRELPVVWSDSAHEIFECFSFPRDRIVSAGAFSIEWGNKVKCRECTLFDDLPFRKGKDERCLRKMIERE